jgi:hypothetical protein
MQKNVQTLIMGKEKWIVGLEWEKIPDSEQPLKVSAKEIAEKNNTNYATSIEYQDVTILGFSSKNISGYSASECLSYANQAEMNQQNINDHNPDWIVIEEIDESKFWMTVIKNGLPLPGTDTILDFSEIKDEIQDYLFDDTFKMFSTSIDIQTLFEPIKKVQNKSIHDLTQNFRHKLKLKKYNGIPTSVIYGSGALLLFAMGAYFVFEHLEGQKLIQQALQAQAQAEAMKKQKVVAYQEKVKAYEVTKIELEQKAKNKVIFGLSGSPSQMLTSWYQTIGNMEVGTHGWKLQKVSCYYQPEMVPAKFACDYLFNRTALSTNRMLLEDFPQAQIDGENASFTQNAAINPRFLASPDISVIDTLKGASTWNAEMISQLQLLKLVNIEYKFNNSTEITYEIPSPPLTPEEEEKGIAPQPPRQVSLGVAQGTLAVKGQDFEFVKEFADNVNFYGAGLRKVNFSLDGNGQISWDATFDYFISTKNGALKSADSTTLPLENTTPVEQKSLSIHDMSQRGLSNPR